MSASNIFNPGNNPLSPLDERYVGQFATAADLPDGYEDDSVAIVQGSGSPKVYKMSGGAWVLVGDLVGGTTGGGGGPATQIDADGTTLDINAITDGEFLKRVGTAIVSAVPTGGTGTTATHLNDGDEDLQVGPIAAGQILARIGAATAINGVGPGFLHHTLTSYTAATLDLSAESYAGNFSAWSFQNACAVTLGDTDTQGGAVVLLLNQSGGNVTLAAGSGTTMTPTSVTLAGSGSWAIAAYDHSSQKWSVMTNITTTSITTLTADLDAAGYKLHDFNFEGARDVPYSLATDSLGMNSAGTVTLRDDINLVYHANVTSALTIKFPTVTAGEAPYGTLSIGLGQNGSITLDTTPAWQWEKVNTSDNAPTIPTTAGSYMHLYYRYDPVSAKYLVSMTRTGDPAAPSGSIQMVENSGQFSNLSLNNRDVHNHTHTYVSTTQDGGIYVVVIFASDATSSKVITADSALTEILKVDGDECDAANLYIGYYKPTQGDLDGGTLSLSFTQTNEIAQFYTFEVTGGNSTAVVDHSIYDASSTDRSAVGPVTLNASIAGDLLISVLMTDNSMGAKSVNNATGWTELLNYDPNPTGDPAFGGFIVHLYDDAALGNNDTPDYSWPTAGEAVLAGVAFKPE